MRKVAIRRISQKRAKTLKLEAKLSAELLEECQGYCMKCHKLPDFRGLSKHEIKMRSQGGDPTEKTNCVLLCGKCHSAQKGIIEK